MCLFGIFIKKIYFVLLMNVFTNFANNITKEVNRLESDINDTIDSVKQDVKVTLETPGQEVDAILIDLRNGFVVRDITPTSIEGLSDTEAKKYILKKLSDIDSNLPPYEGHVIKMEQKESDIEDTREILEDPQIASIFYELRSEFPEPTSTPVPLNTPIPLNTGRLITREPTPNVKIEDFEDIPLSTAERVNKHLKHQFMENFKF